MAPARITDVVDTAVISSVWFQSQHLAIPNGEECTQGMVRTFHPRRTLCILGICRGRGTRVLDLAVSCEKV